MLHHRLLAYLDEVARSGSIRRAAARLGVASSAINRQILTLEAETDTPLFERLPRGLRLTASGEILLRHVRDTLPEHERMRAELTSLTGLARGEVAIRSTRSSSRCSRAASTSRWPTACRGTRACAASPGSSTISGR